MKNLALEPIWLCSFTQQQQQQHTQYIPQVGSYAALHKGEKTGCILPLITSHQKNKGKLCNWLTKIILTYPRKKVDAIQTCGGQKTADGRRYRTGGGILWSILKVRDPNAYKEIMKKGKEFEKQFRQAHLKQEPLQNQEAALERSSQTRGDKITASASDVFLKQDPVEHSNSGANHAPVHDRIRMPVTYDDLFDEGKDSKEPSALMPPEESSYDVAE